MSVGKLVDAASLIQYVRFSERVLAFLHLVRSRPFDLWMKARERAEIARISLFDQVMNTDDPSSQPDELPLPPLKLEHFRRYQLDVQRRYYAARGLQHAQPAGQTRRSQNEILCLSRFGVAVAILALLTIAVQH